MVNKILRIKYDMTWRNIENNETKETKTIADYFKNPKLKKSEEQKYNAKSKEQKHKITFDDIVKQLWKVIHSDEMKDLENSLKNLTEQELEKVNKFIETTIMPEIKWFKKTLKDKWIIEKIRRFREEASQIIKELEDKIKEIKEQWGSKSELIKTKTTVALLRTASDITPENIA